MRFIALCTVFAFALFGAYCMFVEHLIQHPQIHYATIRLYGI